MICVKYNWNDIIKAKGIINISWKRDKKLCIRNYVLNNLKMDLEMSEKNLEIDA